MMQVFELTFRLSVVNWTCWRRESLPAWIPSVFWLPGLVWIYTELIWIVESVLPAAMISVGLRLLKTIVSCVPSRFRSHHKRAASNIASALSKTAAETVSCPSWPVTLSHIATSILAHAAKKFIVVFWRAPSLYKLLTKASTLQPLPYPQANFCGSFHILSVSISSSLAGFGGTNSRGEIWAMSSAIQNRKASEVLGRSRNAAVQQVASVTLPCATWWKEIKRNTTLLGKGGYMYIYIYMNALWQIGTMCMNWYWSLPFNCKFR